MSRLPRALSGRGSGSVLRLPRLGALRWAWRTAEGYDSISVASRRRLFSAQPSVAPPIPGRGAEHASPVDAAPALVRTLEAYHNMLSYQSFPALAAGAGASPPPPPPTPAQPPRQSSLDTLRWHERFMTPTPEGRALRASWQRQVVLETRAVEAAAARYRRDTAAAISRGQGADLPAARRLLVRWFGPLAAAVREEQRCVLARVVSKDRPLYGPYLLLLQPEQLAVIAMHCVLNSVMEVDESGGPVSSQGAGVTKMPRLMLNIGRAVENQVNLDKLQALCRRSGARSAKVRTLRAQGEALRARLLRTGVLAEEDWRRWHETGAALRRAGDLLPLDALDWFAPDDAAEGRLARLALQAPLSGGDAARGALQAAGMRGSGPAPSHRHAGPIMAQVRRLLRPELAENWTTDTQAKVGAALIKLLIDTATVEVRGGSGGEGDGHLPGRRNAVQAPAFEHRVELFESGAAPGVRGAPFFKRYGVLSAHPEVLRRVRPSQNAEVFCPVYTPMLLPPVPWLRHDLGGHLTLRAGVMRFRGSHLQLQLLARADEAEERGRGTGARAVYKALDALGATPWAVHRPVFRVASALWAAGGGMCDVPSREDVLPPPLLTHGFKLQPVVSEAAIASSCDVGEGDASLFPPPPPARPRSLLLFDYGANADRASRAGRKRAKRRASELHSLRCDMEYKLAVAREFVDTPRFYYPHNVDFRGRAYPMHPHLNHLGSDLCRGMLRFADSRPLGEGGLGWLYVQAANLWGQGVDKLPHEQRRAWAEGHLARLRANSRDPFAGAARRVSAARAAEQGQVFSGMDGSLRESGLPRVAEGGPQEGVASVLPKSMLEDMRRQVDRASGEPAWWLAEAPFQFLATCMEIDAALASGDPASFRSSLPVHMDGSCNGLQHYAALGRDLSGGRAVNLVPGNGPQDVYSEIARLVARRVAADAAKGSAHARALLAATAVDRKLVKQTVMTSVYGVTFVGAREQISSRLRERGFQDDAMLYKVSCYAAKATLDSLHEMFSSAKHIMHWLSDCARIVARAGQSVSWVTPLGLPIVQPYRKSDKQHIRTLLQRLVLVENNDALPVLKMRQRTAFPPNYIHSVDSTHMMMTASRCAQEGMAFAGVHDSFWTHAGDVERMNAILRDCFVELHSQPLLEDLIDHLRTAHPDLTFPPIPDTGELDLDCVRDSTYFFS